MDGDPSLSKQMASSGPNTPSGSLASRGDTADRAALVGLRMVLVVPTCPVCDEPGIPLLFGLPVPEAREAAGGGQLALAGCIMPDDPPNWQCPQGHRWRHDDEEAWNAQLLTVLIAHGYEPLSDEVES